MKRALVGLLLTLHTLLGAQTIAEKKAGLAHYTSTDLTPEMQDYLSQINLEHEALSKELQASYAQAYTLFQQNAPEYAYKDLLQKINATKQKIIQLETRWREMATTTQGEEYALWHQPETTLEQLVVDYGSQDYVYIFSPDIAKIDMSVTSNLPIPRSSWNEMLELILTQNGVGVKQLNPYLRQLYLIKEDHSSLKLITNNKKDLAAFPGNERIAFVLSPEASDVRRVWFFLEKFINPNSVVMQMIGRDILIVAQVSEIQELLKLYDFISINRGNKEYKAVTLTRVDAEEMAKILSAIFGGLTAETVSPAESDKSKSFANNKGLPPKPGQAPFCQPEDMGDNGLRIIPLTNVARAVFLVGTREEIRKAENIIFDVEEQVGESRGRVIYWYTTRHSDPEDLADVLFRVYSLMVASGGDYGTSDNLSTGPGQTNVQNVKISEPPPVQVPLLPPPYATAYYLGPPINALAPPPPPEVNQGRDNFIVDLKTGAIVMVVEAYLLPKMKELIKKLDIPTKMVQLEVLLFEKRLTREDNFGLNLLRIGSAASQTTRTSATFNENATGIFDFILRRKANDLFPAFDLTYRFLLTQEDVHINANPSILTANQTPAIIEIAEEISVNTGIFEVETQGGVTLKDAFARAQYGIKIEITPTIHSSDCDGGEDFDSMDYVDLATDITFQTFTPSTVDRPDVTTRHIVNEVSIPDGQTVILGGLRRRNSRDFSEKIPFFGEIPGLGKLFSLNEMRDETTEMFIFITPKIVNDPVSDLDRIRQIEMNKRPGDIPAFMCRLVAAEEREKNRLFAASMAIMLGRKPDRCVPSPYEDTVLYEEPLDIPCEEYDGR